MLIDYRYHLFTLVAVFLAFGLGVLVGGALFSDETLIKSQTELVNRLERDFVALRTENQKLTQQINLLRIDLGQERKFIEWLVPQTIAGKLQNQTFAFIKQGALTNSYVNSLKKLFEDSGARVVAQLETDPAQWSQVSADDFKVLAGVLAVGLRGPSLSRLEQRGLIQLSASHPIGAQNIVLIGETEHSHWFQEQLVQAGLRVYAAPSTLSTLEEQARFILELSGVIADEHNHSYHPGI